MLKKKKKEEMQEAIKTTELSAIANGRNLRDLKKIVSTRNCQVFEVDKDTNFILLNEKLRGNLVDIKKAAESYGINPQVLEVKDIISDKETPIGYSTVSYDMTLNEYFLTRDPDVYTTKIILKCLRDKIIGLPVHGDLTLDDIVLKKGEIFITNRFLKRHCITGFEYLGEIQRELVTLYDMPKNYYPKYEETDNAIYDYLYYLLINTSGEERKQMITAGLESCYKTLFKDIPNKHIEDEKYYTVAGIIKSLSDEEYIKEEDWNGHTRSLDIRMF